MKAESAMDVPIILFRLLSREKSNVRYTEKKILKAKEFVLIYV